MTNFKKVLGGVCALALSLGLPPAPALAQFSQQATWGVCGGTANAQTIQIANVGALADLVGVSISCYAGVPNTASMTLSVNGSPATLVKKPSVSGLANLSGGELNGPIVFLYDGTEFVIISQNYGQVIPPHNTWTQTVHGSYPFTVPVGIYWIDPTVVGAGGGGGTGGGNVSNQSGGGGGGGGTSSGWIPVVPGQVITATVGQGGAGSGASGVSAGTGGTSSFQGLSATGGGGGVLTLGMTASGGAGGVGTGGVDNITGGVGGDGNMTTPLIQGGGGGSSSQGGGGRTSTVGLPGRPDVINGVAPGSGAGGVWGSGTTNQTGGNGADGKVSIGY